MIVLKKLKKTKIWATALLLIGTLTLSACSDSKTIESSEKVELTLWHYYNGATKDMLNGMINEFNETVGVEKNIVVDAYSYSSVNDLATALVSSANKEVGFDSMPDIFSAYGDTALFLDNLGVVANMDSYFSEEEIALFRQDFLNDGRFDSEQNLKILPVAKSTELLFLNNTTFQIFANETGVGFEQLATWEGLAEVAELYYNWTDAQTEEEYDGRALFGIDSEANFIIISAKQLGDDIYSYDGENVTFGLSEESAKLIWDNYMVPYIKGYYVSQGSFRSDDVKSGDLIMYVGSTSSVYYFPSLVELGRTESYSIDGITLPYPYFENGEKIVVQQGAGMIITKTDELRESASAEFLKWFTSSENNLNFAVSTGYMPVQNEALSYYSVLSVMDSDETSKDLDIISSSVDVTYNSMLPEYEFYSGTPFVGSYDSRNAIRDYITSTLDNAFYEIENQMSLGIDRNTIIEELTNYQNFKEWYDKFRDTINDVLIENK